MRRSRIKTLNVVLGLAIAGIGVVVAYQYFDAKRNLLPFADARLHLGMSRMTIIDDLGDPAKTELSNDGSFERLEYRRGEFALELTIRDGKLQSWSEKGPFQIRLQTERTSGCCE